MSDTHFIKQGQLPEHLLRLTARSEQMDRRIRELIGDLSPPLGPRAGLAQALYSIGLEHAAGLRTLFLSGNPVPGLALLRPHAEALARASWARYTATDKWLLSYLGPRSAEGSPLQFHANPARLITELKETAPEEAYLVLEKVLEPALLNTFHAFTHGGRQVVDGIILGYDQQVLDEALRITNCLTMFATAELISLCNCDDRKLLKRARIATKEFDDCLGTQEAGWLSAPTWKLPEDLVLGHTPTWRIVPQLTSGHWELWSPGLSQAQR